MYFASEQQESILSIIKTQIEGMDFELQISRTFFEYEGSIYAKKHNHAHYEVFLNKGCFGEMSVDNERILFKPGSMIIVAPGAYHAYKPDASSSGSKYNLKFKFSESPRSNRAFEELRFRYIEDAGHIIDIAEQIHKIYNSKEFAATMETECCFNILLINILRCITESAGSSEKPSRQMEQTSSINEIEKFFEEHYGSFPSPSDLAKHLNVSTRQLDRILKQLFSMSFSAKLALTKTELAKDLLETTDMSVVTISENLGYNSPAGFSAAFKKQTGISPNTYRQNNKR